MARITIHMSDEELDGDYGTVEGVAAECSRCGHRTESFGRSEASAARCAALMREECPRGEKNFYVENRGIHPDDF